MISPAGAANRREVKPRPRVRGANATNVGKFSPVWEVTVL